MQIREITQYFSYFSSHYFADGCQTKMLSAEFLFKITEHYFDVVEEKRNDFELVHFGTRQRRSGCYFSVGLCFLV
jgi:hypothetical protein